MVSIHSTHVNAIRFTSPMSVLRVLVILSASLACLPQGGEGARVLAVFPMPMRSHWIVCRSLLQALHARGHQLTVITPYSTCERCDNWTELLVPDTSHLVVGAGDLFSTGHRGDLRLLALFNYGLSSCEVLLQEESLRDLFKSDREFDVIIIETFFNDCLLALAHKFRVPIIGFSTLVSTVWMSDMMGSPHPLSYVSEPFLPYTDRMTFWERMHNAIFATFTRAFRHIYYIPKLDAMMRHYMHDPAMPSLLDIERNTSLLFVNSHPSLHFPRPLVPNIIDVGGMHVNPPQKLPQNLREFFDNATDGAILFSLGSNLKCSQMPEDKRTSFLTAFSKLKQRILWKCETEDLPGQPRNLKLAKWLPQSDILAHKNIKLFITHGGLGSTIEAVYHGVPLIGIPVFADQYMNIVTAEKLGYALRLQFSNITADTLLWAITEVLNNPRYQQQAQRLSRVFHDRPRPPLEEAVFWTEYVLRHRGAPHLRSAALSLSWYQLCLLDVAAVVMGAAAVVLVLLLLVLKAAAATLRSKRPKTAVIKTGTRNSEKNK